MAYREISNITQNKTLMTFIFSAIATVVLVIVYAISGSISESQDRATLLENSNFIKSELNVVKAQILEELSRPDNVTLVNPGNVTVVVPGDAYPQSTHDFPVFEDISIVRDK